VYPAETAYLQAVREACDRHNALLVFDEVQTGLARTGRWFGFQHFGVSPDVVTMAKALGNGVPIGACWAKADVAAAFSPGDHATTYGGQPLATAAARAVLDTMQELDAPRLATEASSRIVETLGGVPGVAEIRGLGLLLAVELDGHNAPKVAAACMDHGLVVNGVTPTALRLAPPLVIEQSHIDEAAEVLSKVLSAPAVQESVG
jgi:acetylornithine/succinyldiaminopimelate/putrescine aminotransferase